MTVQKSIACVPVAAEGSVRGLLSSLRAQLADATGEVCLWEIAQQIRHTLLPVINYAKFIAG